jgi:predicted dienelactone hydrolase
MSARGASLALVVGLAVLGAARVAAGAFAVGTTTRTFTTTSATGTPRILPTIVWYPAVRRTGTPDALGLRDATVRRGRFPLVVFMHGTCGRPDEATYLTKALASQGFVVAAPAHPGLTADDLPGCLSLGALLEAGANALPDVRVVIDAVLAEASDPSSRFARRLRPAAMGMAGLSFGGWATLLGAQEEPRVGAALALVPGGTALLPPGDIAVPTMVIGSERDQVVGFAESEKAYQRLAGPRFLVELLGGNHLSVVDSCSNLCVPGDISQDDAHRLVLHYAIPFLRRYVAGQPVASRRLVPATPGATVEAEPRRR